MRHELDSLGIQLTVDKPIDAGEFEKRAMKEIGAPAEIVMRHRSPRASGTAVTCAPGLSIRM